MEQEDTVHQVGAPKAMDVVLQYVDFLLPILAWNLCVLDAYVVEAESDIGAQ